MEPPLPRGIQVHRVFVDSLVLAGCRAYVASQDSTGLRGCPESKVRKVHKVSPVLADRQVCKVCRAFKEMPAHVELRGQRGCRDCREFKEFRASKVRLVPLAVKDQPVRRVRLELKDRPGQLESRIPESSRER